MEKWQNQTEKQMLEHIRSSVGRVEFPVDSYNEQIMNRIEHLETRGGSKLLKKTLAAASIAAVIGLGTITAGFISPAWADTLSQLPVFNSIFKHTENPGLKLAAEQGLTTSPNMSVTKDGVTLSVTEVFYDGIQLAIGFERAGVADERMLAEITDYKTHEFDQSTKGLLGLPEVTLESGERMGFGSSSTGDVQGQPNTLLLEMRELWNTSALGDEFKVNISVPVAQIAEPFKFQVTVKKLAEGIINLTPGQGASKDSFHYKVKSLDITPAAMRLVVTSEGEVPASPEQTGEYGPTEVFYELVDDAGNVIGPKGLGYAMMKAVQHPIVDSLYNTFPQKPKTITVRPYTMTLDNEPKLLLDADGKPVKTYMKELETTIQIP
ncbi:MULTISPECIES: DUF4179 domain-containing protein [unclassified Paenibacillus]|uniref:DUF4179 domain-containing protein n=1 Tax=unclassified Paenibacillus TaxID=185978 RepID=UPI0003E29CBA|nr:MULTISPECIES: DUF4179 domain-containing protein [unclassified Paenibacillus]ETT53197.1 hypothetical protein C162_08089 [Paenibacillus sp. FSL R7-269]OMF92470.1 hypothetical protein BK147_19360 [Paenibacillus sp. FSL R7-0337]